VTPLYLTSWRDSKIVDLKKKMVEFISQILVKKDQNRKKNLKPQLRRDGCGDVVGWSLSVEGSYNESFHLREKLFHCKRKKLCLNQES
jgi:hypothetical protein